MDEHESKNDRVIDLRLEVGDRVERLDGWDEATHWGTVTGQDGDVYLVIDNAQHTHHDVEANLQRANSGGQQSVGRSR